MSYQQLLAAQDVAQIVADILDDQLGEAVASFGALFGADAALNPHPTCESTMAVDNYTQTESRHLKVITIILNRK